MTGCAEGRRQREQRSQIEYQTQRALRAEGRRGLYSHARPLRAGLDPGVLEHRDVVRGAELHQGVEAGVAAAHGHPQLEGPERLRLPQQAALHLRQRLPAVGGIDVAVAQEAVRVPAHQLGALGIALLPVPHLGGVHPAGVAGAEVAEQEAGVPALQRRQEAGEAGAVRRRVPVDVE